MEPFHIKQKPGVPDIFVLDSWTKRFPTLEAGFSSRLGGVSGGSYDSLNCGLHVGDDPGQVIQNRRRLASATSLPFASWTYAEQVHERRIAVVTHREKGAGRDSRETALQHTDGFVTNEPGICLCAQFADCVPLYFYDPLNRAIGLAHAGWKGSVLKVAMATIDTLAHTFGSRPESLHAAIGPSIGVCCYEVDDKVIEHVNQTAAELGIGDGLPEGGDPVYHPCGNGKYMLDLQQFNRQIMIKAGIMPANIELSRRCTSCHTEWFYSHRKENGKTGRMAAWIGML